MNYLEEIRKMEKIKQQKEEAETNYSDNTYLVFEEFVFSIISKIIKKGLDTRTSECEFSFSIDSPKEKVSIIRYGIGDIKYSSLNENCLIIPNEFIQYISNINGIKLVNSEKNSFYEFKVNIMDLATFYYEELQREEHTKGARK